MHFKIIQVNKIGKVFLTEAISPDLTSALSLVTTLSNLMSTSNSHHYRPD